MEQPARQRRSEEGHHRAACAAQAAARAWRIITWRPHASTRPVSSPTPRDASGHADGTASITSPGASGLAGITLGADPAGYAPAPCP